MFDAKDGREVWRVTRTDVPTWGTPTIHQVNGQTQFLCTPLVYRGLVYIIRYNGVLVVFDAKTGDKKYEQRLAGATNAITASPVVNDGKVYAASEDGQVFVLKAGPVYEVLALNEMSTPVLATPAISDGRLLLRTQDQVMAIGKK